MIRAWLLKRLLRLPSRTAWSRTLNFACNQDTLSVLVPVNRELFRETDPNMKNAIVDEVARAAEGAARLSTKQKLGLA